MLKISVFYGQLEMAEILESDGTWTLRVKSNHVGEYKITNLTREKLEAHAAGFRRDEFERRLSEYKAG